MAIRVNSCWRLCGPAASVARQVAPYWADASGVSSPRISRASSSRSRWPCVRPAILARFVFSQSCSWLARVVSRTLERARLTENDRIRQARLNFLAEASDLLVGSLDQEKTIALAAQLVVPRLAAWCAALLPDEDGQLRPGYVWHADESRVDVLTALLNEALTAEVGDGVAQMAVSKGAGRWSLAGPASRACSGQPTNWPPIRYGVSPGRARSQPGRVRHRPATRRGPGARGRGARRGPDPAEGLRSLLAECSELNAGSVVARILRAVREFGSDPPADDLALLVFRGL